jgi:hypothetical protein
MPGMMDDPIEHVIARLRSQAREFWLEAPPADFQIVRRMVRPYSRVYRLQLGFPSAAANRTSPRFVYVKMMTPGAKFQANPEKYLNRLATEFAAGRRLNEALNGAQEFAVVKPVAYYPEWLALVSEEAPGVPLSRLIERHGLLWPRAEALNLLSEHCRRAGQALAAIQKATAESTPFDPASLIEYIDLRLHRLVESDLVPFSAGNRRQIMRFLENAIPAIPAGQLAQSGSHSDYAPFNLLAADKKITVADFTMFKAGSVYNDLTYFHHRLEGYLHKPIYRPRVIRRLQEAFLRGYVEAAAPRRREWHVENDALFKVLQVKHVVNNYSAIMRQRVVVGRRGVPLPVQLFNQHVFRRYNQWLEEVCR